MRRCFIEIEPFDSLMKGCQVSGFRCRRSRLKQSDAGCQMLDAGWNEVKIPSLAGIKKKSNTLVHPVSRNQHPVSRGNKQQLLAIPKT
jgi:hypothetical protein